MASFQKWLLEDRHLAISTGAVYVSHLRGLLQNQERADELVKNPERFRGEVCQYDANLTQSGAVYSRGSFRSAVRAFVDFALSKGIDLGSGFSTTQRERTPPLPRAPIGHILRELERRKVPFRRLVYLRWRDVSKRYRVEGTPAEIDDPETKAIYHLPVELLKELSMWAGNGKHAGPNQPLIPTVPGGMEPMATRLLRLLARGP